MLDVIKNYCENEKTNGLFLMDLPTGFGKTHNVIQYIFDASIKPENKDKKYFFITNLKKNLPEKQLRNLFEKKGMGKEFEEKFLYLNSNAELAIDGYTKHQGVANRIPKELWDWDETKFFFQDLKDIVKTRSKNGNSDGSSSLENTFATKIEPDFRHKVEMLLKSEYKKVEDRRKAIESDERWKWLGELYESTKTKSKQIIILSAKKFVTKNSTIVDAPYLFYTNDIINNAVVFIDEFDAVKKDFLDNIIDDGIREQIDYIDLFLDIHGVLQTKVFQKNLGRKSNWYLSKKYRDKPVESIIDGFRENANRIFENYNLFCDIRTDRNQDLSKNFLFQDSQYHAITNDKKLISVAYNEDESLTEILLSDMKPEGKSENIQIILSKIRGFVTFFQIGVSLLALNMHRYRQENHIGDGEFTYEAAVSTVLKQFRLKDKYVYFLKNQILQNIRKKDDKGLSKEFDLSFFAKGLRYYAFTNDVMDDLKSVIMMFSFSNTPEKILLSTCERAKVVGISATATIPSSIGNFNLDYLKEQLGENFQEMSKEDKNRLREKFYKEQSGYSNVEIHAELLGKNVRDCCDEKSWMNLYNDAEIAKEAFGIVCDAVPTHDKSGFHKERYYRIVEAYKKFYENSDINSFLCILPTHPKDNAGSLRRKTLIELFSYIDKGAEQKIEWLTTDGFEESKKNVLEKLEKGSKCFVISAYATIGAGQNLQYKIPSRLTQSLIRVNNSRKGNEKDFDGIYLDNPTHLLVNTSTEHLSQKDFVKFLFQIEYLQAAGEISSDLAMQHICRGFDAYATQHISYKKADKISNRESVKLLATRDIIQAVGRICRTNYKSSKIYIYADSRIAENLDCTVANDLILNHEFMKLLELVKASQGVEIIKGSKELQAEDKSKSVNSCILGILNENWTDINVERWKKLRDFALKHPTASKQTIAEAKMASFYAEFETKSNCLYFGQEWDYKKVHVSFSAGNPQCTMVESESACKLDRFMLRTGIKKFFEDNGFATSFERNDCIMVPTYYNNIYKGALGEVIGRYIFSTDLLNIELEEIEDLNAFELFDYKVPNKPIYVDFKHWSLGTDVERDSMIDKICEKAHKCGCQKALVVNILAERELPCHNYVGDGVEILAVPSLLIDDEKMRKNDDAVEQVRRFVGGANEPV